MKTNDLKEKVEKCKTEKQVRNLLKKAGIKIVKDIFDRLDDLTRIYKDRRQRKKPVKTGFIRQGLRESNSH